MADDKTIQFEDYEKHPNGEIITWPISGWEGFYAYEDRCAIRLKAITSKEQMENDEFKSVQIVLTPAQCRAMSNFLIQIADHAEKTYRENPNLPK